MHEPHSTLRVQEIDANSGHLVPIAHPTAANPRDYWSRWYGLLAEGADAVTAMATTAQCQMCLLPTATTAAGNTSGRCPWRSKARLTAAPRSSGVLSDTHATSDWVDLLPRYHLCIVLALPSESSSCLDGHALLQPHLHDKL